MAEREKVIKGLEVCLAADLTEDENPCAPCPYFFDGMCLNTMKKDALDLLREQEPVEPKVSEWMEDSDPGQEYGTTWACRKCMHSIHKPFIWNPYDCGYKYCFHCGARMEVRLNA